MRSPLTRSLPLSASLVLLIVLLGNGVAQAVTEAEKAEWAKIFCDQAGRDVRWFVQRRDAGVSRGKAWREYKRRNKHMARPMRVYWKDVAYWAYVYPDVPEKEVVAEQHFFCLIFPPKLPIE